MIAFPIYVTMALVFFRPRFSQSGSLDVPGLGLRHLKLRKRTIEFVDRPYPTQKTPSVMSIERVVVLGGEDTFKLDANESSRLQEAVDGYIEEAKEADQTDKMIADDECKPIADWAQKMFPVCNAVHELNLFEASGRSNRQILGKPGWFRQAWKVDDGDPHSPKLALKTLR